ncbi:incA family protein [Chlamydia psittaci C19/98]|nr:putative TMH-family membrane protein [Chlamydia psittaci 08DC60]EPJ28871.1 incA family protein [Chlamydia psittaci C19/98]EPJ98954.1 incA family protein [Chlamydia psittaci 02DC24]
MTSPVNTNPIATHVPTTQHALSSISASKYQRIATAIALLAGMVLIGTLIGTLVFFALPTSVTLVALVSTALLASVILLSMSMYNVVSQSRRVPGDARLGEENTRLQAEMIELREQLICSEARLEEERGRCSELSVKLMSAIGDLAQANQEKASLESKVQALKELVASYPPIAEEAQKMQEELGKRTLEVALAKQNIGALEEQVQSLETQLTHSLEQVDALSAQKEELEACLQQLQDEGVSTVITLQGKLIDLTEKIEVKDQDVERLKNQNADLAIKVRSLEEELEKDQVVVEGLENRITMLAYTRNELSLKVKNLNCDLESRDEVILGLEGKIQELEDAKKKVEDDFRKMQNQNKELEASISHKVRVTMQETSHLLVQIAKLKEQLDESTGEIKILQSEKSSLTSGMDKLQEQLDQLQAQLAAHASIAGDTERSDVDPDGSEALSVTDDYLGTEDLEDLG